MLEIISSVMNLQQLIVCMYCMLGESSVEFLRSGVVSATRNKHDKNWVVYKEYMDKVIRSGDYYLVRMSLQNKVAILVQFLQNCLQEKKMSATKAINCLGSVRFYFQTNSIPLEIFGHDSLELARRACNNTESGRERNLNREKNLKEGVTIEMIELMRRKKWTTLSGIDDKMTYLAVALAYHFMLRRSEYIYSRDTDHAILTEDVILESREGSRYFPWLMRESAVTVDIVKIDVVVRSSKTDKKGIGKYLSVSSAGENTAGEKCLIQDMVHWCMIAGFNRGDPFFSRYAPRKKNLTASMVGDLLKEFGEKCGIERNRVSTHSLRIGGATSLRESGVNRDMIKRIGGWADGSNVDERYSRTTASDRGALSVVGKSKKR